MEFYLAVLPRQIQLSREYGVFSCTSSPLSRRDFVPMPGVGRRPTLGISRPLHSNPNRGCVRHASRGKPHSEDEAQRGGFPALTPPIICLAVFSGTSEFQVSHFLHPRIHSHLPTLFRSSDLSDLQTQKPSNPTPASPSRPLSNYHPSRPQNPPPGISGGDPNFRPVSGSIPNIFQTSLINSIEVLSNTSFSPPVPSTPTFSEGTFPRGVSALPAFTNIRLLSSSSAASSVATPNPSRNFARFTISRSKSPREASPRSAPRLCSAPPSKCPPAIPAAPRSGRACRANIPGKRTAPRP